MAECKEAEEQDMDETETEKTMILNLSEEVFEVPKVELTIEEKAAIADKRAEKTKWNQTDDARRAKEAKARNDIGGWPMPETKETIAGMAREERLSVGLRFTTKNAVLSRLMAVCEYDKKRYVLEESRPLCVVAKCPFADQEDCEFELRAGFHSTVPYKSYRDLTIDDKQNYVAGEKGAKGRPKGKGGGS